ncbi:hypothetical protein [Acinetobacter terrae]|uniref:Uncharacterized protein n=1 Tax=Acinetobacter terrae TaxID=2731247 RepID=A0A4R0ENX4_9GAMM|nr:hypothetical protein [Acinetobacter terrae]TCB60382.1 hypothetical protein E0H85_05705 [Acinetobacter terrae]
MIDDDFDLDDFEREVTRIPQNQNAQNKLGKGILQNAEQYLQQMSAGEHTHLIQALRQHAQVEAYFDVLADDLDQPVDAKFANDALNLIHIWSLANQHEDDLASFDLLDVINTDYFQTEMLEAFDALEIDAENKAQRRLVIQEAFKLYEMQCFAGCIPLLYAQLEGLLTDVLIERGFLKQNQTKFVDVYKIVPGLKGHEIKSLWHKTKIACEMNVYFAELAAYKMDSSSTVTMTRHNILHGTDVSHFSKERNFILFIWLFSVVSFMSTLRK